jgi:hypothetical protein
LGALAVVAQGPEIGKQLDPGSLRDALINTALKRVAKAGDGGSTVLGTLMTLLLAGKVDWDLASKIFSNADMPAALEAGKILGILLLWLTSYVCGKKEFEQPERE